MRTRVGIIDTHKLRFIKKLDELRDEIMSASLYGSGRKVLFTIRMGKRAFKTVTQDFVLGLHKNKPFYKNSTLERFIYSVTT